MEFRSGRPMRLAPPPQHLPALPIRLSCPQRPAVSASQSVRAGDVLADPVDPLIPGQLCPVTGTVAFVIERRRDDTHDYEIQFNPSDEQVPTSLELEPPHKTSLCQWLGALRRVGPWPQDGLSFGLTSQLAAAVSRPPKFLICLGLDRFPPYPDRSSLLLSFAQDAVLGLQMIADIAGATRTMLLVGRGPEVCSELKSHCRNAGIRLRSVNNIYPHADPTLVLWRQTSGSRKLPQGADPMSRGVMLITPWTAIRLGRWLTSQRLDGVQPLMIGRPDADRRLTAHWVFPGQPLARVDPDLSEASPNGRVVIGHPLAGQALQGTDANRRELEPVVLAGEQLASVVDPLATPEPEPCISCGWCVDVCPTQLRPAYLMERSQRRMDDFVVQQLRWCVNCGLCSHVCPSHLPVAQSLDRAKRLAVVSLHSRAADTNPPATREP